MDKVDHYDLMNEIVQGVFDTIQPKVKHLDDETQTYCVELSLVTLLVALASHHIIDHKKVVRAVVETMADEEMNALFDELDQKQVTAGYIH